MIKHGAQLFLLARCQYCKQSSELTHLHDADCIRMGKIEFESEIVSVSFADRFDNHLEVRLCTASWR